ncbi:unnamed protein product [Allacma fusca]|uniref:Uncharacterized protein n=1 Tax=Allacma fusca TaxID=39272 RepID=A0A8J2LKY1_9HEXA|nr:unnamed protein product [Allacma fusca]
MWRKGGGKRRDVSEKLDILYPDTDLQFYTVDPYAAPDPVTTYSATYSVEKDEPILSQLVPRKGIHISTVGLQQTRLL